MDREGCGERRSGIVPRQVALRPFWASGDAACERWPSLDSRALAAVKHSCTQTRMFPTCKRGTALLKEKVDLEPRNILKPLYMAFCVWEGMNRDERRIRECTSEICPFVHKRRVFRRSPRGKENTSTDGFTEQKKNSLELCFVLCLYL